MRRVFIEAPTYKAKFRQLKETDSLSRKIEKEIMRDPGSGDLVKGTGGVRKIRVAKDGKGKSGSFRVLYLDIPDKEKTFLIYILAKNEAENIDDEEKKVIKVITDKLKKESKKA